MTARTRSSYVPKGRGLHSIDFENLTGGPMLIREHGGVVAKAYRDTVGVRDDDHVIIGVNPKAQMDAVDAFPGSRIVGRPGPDGADLALLKELEDIDWIVSRFDRVVIGSGDHIFVPIVAKLRQRGIVVVVVGLKGHVSAELARVATITSWLPPSNIFRAGRPTRNRNS